MGTFLDWYDGQEENSRGSKVLRRVADWQEEDGIVDDVACRRDISAVSKEGAIHFWASQALIPSNFAINFNLI
jgi:hypothetical protein